MAKSNFNVSRFVFFDTNAVRKATSKAERKVLNRFGAMVRTTAKRSIRKATKRTRQSEPGDPPRSHTAYLKRGIFYGFDIESRSVVVGPVKSKSGNIPEALEYGGTTKQKKTGDTIDIEPRPFMGPALDKMLPKLPALWKDSVK